MPAAASVVRMCDLSTPRRMAATAGRTATPASSKVASIFEVDVFVVEGDHVAASGERPQLAGVGGGAKQDPGGELGGRRPSGPRRAARPRRRGAPPPRWSCARVGRRRRCQGRIDRSGRDRTGPRSGSRCRLSGATCSAQRNRRPLSTCFQRLILVYLNSFSSGRSMISRTDVLDGGARERRRRSAASSGGRRRPGRPR